MAKPEEILKSARESKGYTQASLAAAIGISSRMLQRYEEGRFPKYKSDSVRKVDELLGTSLYEIIYDTTVPQRTASPDSNSQQDDVREEIFLNGPIKLTAQEYVDALKSDKKKLEDDKKQLQKMIDLSLEAMQQLLSSLSRHDRAYHETILLSLARIEKLPKVGDLILEADTREAAKLLEEQNKHTEKEDNFRKKEGNRSA